MEVLELKTCLLDLLKTELGTYTTSTNIIYPSIFISPPLVPQDWKVKGLEVTLYLWNEKLSSQSISGLNEGVKLERRNLVFDLVQFDTDKSVMNALNLISAHFPKSMYNLKPQTRDSYESARVTIYDPIYKTNIKHQI